MKPKQPTNQPLTLCRILLVIEELSKWIPYMKLFNVRNSYESFQGLV